MKVFIDYVLAKMGYVKITPQFVRLNQAQEVWIRSLHDAMHVDDRHVVEPFLDNQKAINKYITTGRCILALAGEGP